MKLRCILLVLLLLAVPVSAELRISCEKDVDCLAFTGENKACMYGYCGVLDSYYMGLEDFSMKKSPFVWSVVDMKKGSEYTCNKEGCISFAPVNNQYKNFMSWLLYAK